MESVLRWRACQMPLAASGQEHRDAEWEGGQIRALFHGKKSCLLAKDTKMIKQKHDKLNLVW